MEIFIWHVLISLFIDIKKTMLFRLDCKGNPLNRSYIGNKEVYDDIRTKKILGTTLNPSSIERTEDYTKELMIRKTITLETNKTQLRPIPTGVNKPAMRRDSGPKAPKKKNSSMFQVFDSM